MESKQKPIWMYIMKGFSNAAIALTVKLLVSLSALLTYAQENMVADIPNYAVSIVIVVSTVIVYNSAFGLLFSYNRIACDELIAGVKESKSGKLTLKTAICCKSFIAELIPATLLLSIAAALGANWEIAGMFYFGDGKSPYSAGLIPFIVTLIAIPLLLIFERYEAARYWLELDRRGELEEITSKKKIVLRVLLIAVAYPLTLPYLPLIGFLAYTFLSTIALLLTAPVLILIILGIIALIIFVRILASLKVRKKFLKQLNILIREHQYEISEIKNPYSSLFSRKKTCTFTVNNKKSSFDCLVIGRIRNKIPICFTSKKNGFFRHRIGTKKHNVTFERHFEYAAPGDGKKIMIINPTPKHAFICDLESGKEKRLYNADKLWDFVAYEAEAFLGALDRDCLGKYSSVAEKEDVKVPKLPYIKP